MNQLVKDFRPEALADPVDLLLADVAIRIQLTPTDHKKAEDRYGTVNEWLERDGSPLRGRVNRLYAQGSMAVGATIASRLRTDEYDIDIVAELALALNASPQAALDVLYESIRGERGSRYYMMTRRRTRCVTVDYADDMHLDVTPAVLASDYPARTSVIFHHRPEEPHIPGRRLLVNPWGFAEWFKSKTPPDELFAKAYGARAYAFDQALLEKADAEPVPAQQAAEEKSKAVIVLQLLKRWRNVRYDKRKDVRRPPSVVIAKLVAEAANGTTTLSEELLVQAYHLHEVIDAAQHAGEKLRVVNPACATDVLTDRWPESLDAQTLFLRDLEDLVRKVERLRGDCGLEEMRAIMDDLFGESPTGAVFEDFNKHLGNRIAVGQSAARPGSGRLDLGRMGVAPAAAPVARAPATRPHTFYGSPQE